MLYQLGMNNDTGFDPLADTIAVLSQLEIVYFIPVVIILAIMLLTGTFKRRFPNRYTWEAGKGFVRMDMKAKFDSLPLEEQEKLKKQFDKFKT